ncbi:TniQ family protein [Pelotomaculum isophthalicicum JI]|uniref:TniQ family protein n=1 Tax=Pelotomaculum isophthalicicum JI TaxID=947010 RepID=A0A9X4H3I6_9FIRM|nr:TniQ family protein [Pelotomaculum isophthalicicum]MDF9409681.1 TniQ family protein [Pelotomaculum isophthalicicum JI]
MSFDESPLGFFPTPYPDEIFYSVLCRYHNRSGNPAFVSTAKTIWGKKISANLYLPQSLGKVALRIPSETGLTAEYFATRNTIYPFLKPFLSKERGLQVLELLKSEAQSGIMAYQLCRFQNRQWKFMTNCFR